jgi:hypothetical protein
LRDPRSSVTSDGRRRDRGAASTGRPSQNQAPLLIRRAASITAARCRAIRAASKGLEVTQLALAWLLAQGDDVDAAPLVTRRLGLE